MTLMTPAPEIRHRSIPVNGTEIHLAEMGEGPPVIMGHGFPELWYSWRHQLPALAAAGYHAIAIDQRGYGDSGKPEAVEDYDIVHLSDDLIGVLDAIGEEKAVFAGHDWGAPPVWTLGQRFPERMAGLVALSVPLTPRSAAAPIPTMKAMFGDTFFYIVYFQPEGVAEAELNPQAERFLRQFLFTISGDAPDGAFKFPPAEGNGLLDCLVSPDQLPSWLTDEDIATYAAAFDRSGFRGGLNFYRNMDRNWELSESWADNKIEVPTLFLAGSKDPVLAMSPPERMTDLVPGLRPIELIPGAGHWTQQERPDEVNAALLGFLREVLPLS